MRRPRRQRATGGDPTTPLAAAMADSVRLRLPAASMAERRVLISRAVDSLTSMFAVVAESPGSGLVNG
jgi:hypothetical protein